MTPPLEQVVREVRVAPTDVSGRVARSQFRHETATDYHPARNRAGATSARTACRRWIASTTFLFHRRPTAAPIEEQR